MTSIVTDFKSIRRILDRQEQKAEYEANNPKEEQSAYGYLYGVAVPLMDQMGSTEAGRLTGGLSPAVRAFVDGWEYDETLRMWRKYEL